ncbi:Hypothetical protein Minf_1504 [Methylacidiphilum infernorum V4]|uniref:Uncharacterized protein n=1 Tax=Methylacidiphilum infernorum (isolate V4) TaxID=481448 RepID=B3DW55_METI4|nr:Hypothetical protein Minf_1504 [Methylacidiphilum infernorum V4]
MLIGRLIAIPTSRVVFPHRFYPRKKSYPINQPFLDNEKRKAKDRPILIITKLNPIFISRTPVMAEVKEIQGYFSWIGFQ